MRGEYLRWRAIETCDVYAASTFIYPNQPLQRGA